LKVIKAIIIIIVFFGCLLFPKHLLQQTMCICRLASKCVGRNAKMQVSSICERVCTACVLSVCKLGSKHVREIFLFDGMCAHVFVLLFSYLLAHVVSRKFLLRKS